MLVMEKIINKEYFDEFGLIERGYYLNKPQCDGTALVVKKSFKLVSI